MDILKRISVFFLLFLGVLTDFSGDVDINLYQRQQTACLTLKQHKERRDKIIESIAFVESSSNPKAHNKEYDARGYLQIRSIMVDEVNRLFGTDFVHSDCWNKSKSIEIFCLFQEHYNPDWDLEKAARMWNGGCQGHRRASTKDYYLKVKKHYENFYN